LLDKKEVEYELDKLIKIRDEFYKFLDNNIPKNENGSYDFKNNPKLCAKEIYDRFFKLDYQARKLRGFLVEAFEIEAE